MSTDAYDMALPLVFVTGNKKKLEEVCVCPPAHSRHGAQVQAILGPSVPNLVNRALDGLSRVLLSRPTHAVPELQGDPEYISKEKCILAAKVHGARCLRGRRHWGRW